jgi:integrase
MFDKFVREGLYLDNQDSQRDILITEKENETLLEEFQARVRNNRSQLPRIYNPRTRLATCSFISEIPPELIWRLLELSVLHEPDIAFAICLQATSGIRTAEVCNVRQSNCPIGGGGYTYTVEDGKMTSFIINLQYKVNMRSDGVSVGTIKNHRRQLAPQGFLPVIEHYHNLHMERLKSKAFEEGYYPLFVDRNGKALTDKSYRLKFNKLVSYLIKDLMGSNQIELAKLLLDNKLTPNSLRHWFTLQLVDCGLPLGIVARYRGDKTTDAFIHLL